MDVIIWKVETSEVFVIQTSAVYRSKSRLANRPKNAFAPVELRLWANEQPLGLVQELSLRDPGFWPDGVIPVAVERVAQNVDGVHLAIGDLYAGRIGFRIDRASHLQTRIRGGGGDQLNDGLETDERFAAPVLA